MNKSKYLTATDWHNKPITKYQIYKAYSGKALIKIKAIPYYYQIIKRNEDTYRINVLIRKFSHKLAKIGYVILHESDDNLVVTSMAYYSKMSNDISVSFMDLNTANKGLKIIKKDINLDTIIKKSNKQYQIKDIKAKLKSAKEIQNKTCKAIKSLNTKLTNIKKDN